MYLHYQCCSYSATAVFVVQNVHDWHVKFTINMLVPELKCIFVIGEEYSITEHAVLHNCLLTGHTVSLCFNRHFSSWPWVSRYQNVSALGFIGAKG